MSRFRPINPDVDFLLPPLVRERLPEMPERHLAPHEVAVAEALKRVGTGRDSPPYDPATSLPLLIDGYATGCYSSRMIERARIAVSRSSS